MIEVTFFTTKEEGYTAKYYNGDGALLAAELDMDAHLSAGGWCVANIGNSYRMVTNVSQLLIRS